TITIDRRSKVRQELQQLPKLKTFLDSIKRGSINSWDAYLTSFVHFQRFLNDKHKGHNPDSILQKLISNQLDLYELLEGFISFLTGSPKSIRLRVEAIKSYLEYYDIEISSKKFKKRCRMPKVYQ